MIPKSFKRLPLAALIGSALFAGTTFAQPNDVAESSGVSNAQFNAAIQASEMLKDYSNGEAEAQEFFEGPDGLIGIVGKDHADNKMFVVWATANGEALINGQVVYNDTDITELFNNTVSQSDAQVGDIPMHAIPNQANSNTHSEQPNSHQTPSDATGSGLIGLIEDLTGKVTVGTGGKHVYEFYDPYCPYCRESVRVLQPYIDQGKLTVTYIPVGAVNPRSPFAAAALLSMNDPAQGIGLSGGKLSSRNYTEKAQQEVTDNNAVFRKTDPAPATPTFVFIDKDGRQQVVLGAPENPDDILDQM